jgi:hypothetical protein
MVGCGLERGSDDTRERCVVSGLAFHRAMAVLALLSRRCRYVRQFGFSPLLSGDVSESYGYDPFPLFFPAPLLYRLSTNSPAHQLHY